MILWQITAPHFCAGLNELDGRVNDAAPIISWTIGRDVEWLCSYCRKKGWTMRIVRTYSQREAERAGGRF